MSLIPNDWKVKSVFNSPKYKGEDEDRIKKANREFNHLINNAITDGIGEKEWNRLSVRKRKDVIESIFYDNDIPGTFYLTEAETKRILQIQLDVEGD